MFTLDDIKAAHAKVKSGKDFPAYIGEIKSLGIERYEHYVADGHINYTGADNFTIDSPAKWASVNIAGQPDVLQLKHALSIHQQGQTDYPTFCRQAAETGVEKWTVDTVAMTCTYYDSMMNSMLVEHIPAPQTN